MKKGIKLLEEPSEII